MPDGKLVQHILDNTSSSTKQFAINASSLARYYWTYFDSGVQNIQLQLEGVRESALPNGGGSIVHCNRARYIFWFENNTQVSRPSRQSCILWLTCLVVDLARQTIGHIPSWLRQIRHARIRSVQDGGVCLPLGNRTYRRAGLAPHEQKSQDEQNTG